MTQSPYPHPVPPELPGQAPFAPVGKNGLATAALVCGIIGLLFFPVALAALVLGIVALVKANNPGVGGRGKAISGIVMGALGLLIMPALLISILLPSLNRAREQANRIKCMSNMRQIALTSMIYAQENDGEYPPDLATLAANSDLTPGVFCCPSANHTPATGPDWATKIVPGSPNCSYLYEGASLKPNDATPEVLLHEPLSNHRDDGANVAHSDGAVNWLTKRQAEELLVTIGK